MDGTCLECPPVLIGGGSEGQEEDEFIYNHFLDAQYDQQLLKVVPLINRIRVKTLKSSKTSIMRWTRSQPRP